MGGYPPEGLKIMSYDKIKSIKFNKKMNSCFVTGACSNLIPITYSRWEEPIDVYKVFQYASCGGFHILPSCKKWFLLTQLVSKWYSKTEANKVVQHYERATCKVFRALVDKALGLSWKSLSKIRYEIFIDGRTIQRFNSIQGSYSYNYSNSGKGFDLGTLLSKREVYKNLKFKKVS